jgi:peroxiredoxin
MRLTNNRFDFVLILTGYGVYSTHFSLCVAYGPAVSDHWAVQTVDNALVGRCSKQKKDHQGVWHCSADQLCIILGYIFNSDRMRKFIVVLFSFPLLVVACSVKPAENSVSAPQVNEYPDIVLQFENGERLSAKTLEGKNVFVLFQPECDHCQEEAVHIQQRLEEFKGYTLYFISSSPMEQITAFAKTFDLDNKANVKFTWTSTEGVLNHYGSIQTPSVYIYDEGKLKRSFNGQTEIETILSAL